MRYELMYAGLSSYRWCDTVATASWTRNASYGALNLTILISILQVNTL